MSNQNKLTEGPILKNYIAFIIPILLTGFLQQFYNSADSMIVGKFAKDGSTALAAVGATASLCGLIATFFTNLTIGTNVVCAKLYGANDHRGLDRAFHTSVLMGILFGIPLMLIGIFGSKYFLRLMGTPDNVIDKATLYMRLFFTGAPANLVYCFGAATLRSVGDTKRPLFILAFAGIINVLLNIICVVGFGLGVAGVAIGTVASQIVSAILVLRIFSKGINGLYFSLSKLKLHKKEFLEIMAIGVPTGFNGILFSLSNVFLQSAINSLGKATMAAHSVAWNYMCFAFYFVNSGEQGVVCFVGQNVGAKKYDRIGKIVKTGMLVTAVMTMAFSAIVVWQGRPLLSIFTNEKELIEIAMIQVYTAISIYVLYAPGVIFGGALRGMGKSVLPTLINIIGICGVRIGWVTFIWPLNPNLEMIYYSFPVTWITSGVPMFIAYLIYKKKLMKNQQSL